MNIKLVPVSDFKSGLSLGQEVYIIARGMLRRHVIYDLASPNGDEVALGNSMENGACTNCKKTEVYVMVPSE